MNMDAVSDRPIGVFDSGMGGLTVAHAIKQILPNEKIIYFGTGPNKIIIKAWQGHFLLEGSPELIQFGLDAGLGNRNAQGFGMVELV